MADLGILSLGAQINEAELQESISRAQSVINQQIRSTRLSGLKVPVDDTRLYELNDHFKLKKKDYLDLVNTYKSNPLVLKTDLTAFKILDLSLRSLTSHVNDVRKDFETPLRFQVNTAAFRSAHQQLDSFSHHYDQVSQKLRSDPMLQTLSQMQARGGTLKIEVTHKEAKKATSKDDLTKELQNVVKAVRSNRQTAFTSISAGIFENVGLQLSQGIQTSLKKNFNVDFRKLGKSRTDALSVPVKALFTENAELRSAIDKAGSKLDNRFRKAGYTLGESIIEALDSQGTTIQQKLKIVFSSAFKGSDFKKNLQETINELKPEGLAAARAVVAGSYVRGGVQQFGERLGRSREVALQERAVPLAQKRALEILNEDKAKNSAKSVNEDTKQLFITVGGYAGTEGKSGAMLARRLKQDKKLPEGSQVIYVLNKDSDVSKSSVESKPNEFLEKLGLGLGGEWVGEVAKSLAKPNLRGYSKDSIEIAAQALVAKQQNPEVTIKILGESGGGFVAEEAAKILEQMGVKGVEFLGVGTPNFIGGLNAQGNKVISPDESLGLLNKVVGRYGFSNTSTEGQNVLGVKEHPLRYYSEANIAELENFLYGKPQPMSEKQISNLKKQSAEDSKTNFGAMTPKELEETSAAALDNYQYLRRFLVNTEDVNEELAEIAEIYKQIYLKTAKEPQSFKTIRSKLKQASALYSRLASDPGLESGIRAGEIKTELEKTYRDFLVETTKLDGTLYEFVGTQAEKRDIILKDLENLIQKFDNPALGVKEAPEVKLPLNLETKAGELAVIEQETKSMATKAVELITTPILNGLKNAGESIQTSIEDFLVARINDQLMRVPGQPNVLDPSRQIGAIDELRAKDLFKLARLGTGDVTRGGLGAAAKAYSVARGTENVLMAAVPPLGIAKGITQKVGLPMAAFTAAGMLPGVGAAESAATGLTESLLAVPAEQLASAMSGAFGEAVLQTIGNLPLIGGKLAPALTETITQLLTQSAQLAAGGAAEVITPIVGGQVLLGAAGETAKRVLPSIPDEQIQANKQLQASTEARLKQLKSGIEYVSAMLPVNPGEANRIMGRLEEEFPQLKGGVDQAIKALPASNRMAEGGGLAALKGQISQAQKRLVDAQKQIQQFSTLAQSVSNSFQQFNQSLKESNIIDVEAVEVKDTKALPSSKDRLQNQLNLIVEYTKKQLEDIGNEFSRQRETLKNKSLPQEDKAAIAASLDQLADESRKAINDIVGIFGSNTPSEIKKAAQYSRQKITNAQKQATGTLVNAKQSGVAIPDGFNEGIESRLNALKTTGQNLAQVVILAAENELEIRSPSRVFMRIGEMVVAGYQQGLKGLDSVKQVVAKNLKPDDFSLFNQQVAQAGNDPDKQYAALRTAERLRYKMRMAANGNQQPQNQSLLTKSIDVFEKRLGLAEGSVKRFGNVVKTSLLGFAGFTGLQAVLAVLGQISNASLQAARDFDTLSTRIKNFSSSPSQGARNTDFVLGEANRLRLDPLQSMEAFADLSATTTNTQYEGQFTQDLFSSLNQLAKVRGANKNEVAAANRAIIQMITKGEQVYAEELIGQLSEAIPGITNLAARGLNMDVGQMRAQLTSGNIKTSEFLPALLNQANIESSLQIGDTVETSQAKLDNFNNAITEFQIAFGQLALPIEDLRLDVLSSLLQFATDNLYKFINIATAASGALILQALFPDGIITTIGNFVKGINLSSISVGKFGTSLKGLAVNMKSALAPMAAFLGKMVLVSAVISASQTIGDVFKDQGEEIRKFADNSIDNLERYREALGKVVEQQKELSKFEKFTQGRSFLEQNFIGQTIGQDASRLLEGLFTDGALVQNIYRYATGTRGESGFERQRRSQMNTAVDAQLEAGQETISSARGVKRKGTNEESEALRELLKIEKELAEVQAKRRNLPSSDTKSRREYDTQISELLKRQQTAREPLGILQTTLASDIEQYKSTLAILEDERNSSSISDDRRIELDSQIEKVRKQLEKANNEQDKLNKKLKDTIPTAKQLERAFALITNRLQDQNVQVQIQASKQQENIALSQLSSGLSTGQSQFLNDLQQQVALTEQIKNNQQAIADIQKELSGSTVTNALEAFDLNTDITQLQPTDIEKRLKERTTETPEREVLEGTLGQLRNLQQLELDTQNLQTQIAQNRVQAQEQLKQSSREIAEYFKSITRESQEIALATQQTDLDVAIIEAKNKLKQGLRGFGNRFFGGLIDSILELVDTLYEPLQNSLDFQRQKQEFQNQLNDRISQGNDIRRNAYGANGPTVPFEGVIVTDEVDSSGEPGLDYVVSNGERGAKFGAVAAGEVIEVQRDDRELGTGGERGYGNVVIVRAFDEASGEFVDMLYAHMDDILVDVGDQLEIGSVIGTQGQTGSTTGPHVSLDFFGEGSYSPTTASLNMRDRVARQLSSNPQALNAQISQPSTNTNTSQPTTTASNATRISDSQLYQLATIANLEASTPQGRVDVAHNIFNRINDGNFGSNATEVIFAPGQYEPVSRYGLTPEGTSTREGAIQSLVSAGYTLDQATSALDETLRLFADPQANASAREHVGGRLYFKGVSMYGNMHPTDRLRQQGENFYHDEGESEEYMRQLASRGPTAIVGSNGAPSGTLSTQGVDVAQDMATGNYETQVDNAMRMLEARDAQAAINLQQNIDKIRQQSRQQREDLSDERIAQERQQEDLLYEAQNKTPQVEYERQQSLNLRGFDDRTLNLRRTIREAEEGLEQLEYLRSQITTMPEFADVLPEILPGLDESITSAQSDITKLEEIYNKERTIYETQQKALEENYQRQERQRRLQARSRTVGVDNQLLQLLAESERRNGRGMQAITYEGIAQRQQIELDFETGIAELEELKYQGELTNEEFEQLRSNLEKIRDTSLDNLTEQLREQQTELQRSSFNQLFDSKQNLGQGMVDRYSVFGLQNRDLERDLALNQQQFSFENQIAEIDRAVASGQLLADTAANIKNNLTALNDIKLQNINDQFNPLTQGLGYVQQGFSQLTANLLTSSGSIEDVLKNMMNNFANFAAQLLTNELFSAILGDGFGLLGGGVGALGGKQKGIAVASPQASTGGSLLQTGASLVMSMFAGGFSSGGLVPSINGPSYARQGNNPIAQALRREGIGSVFATLLPGERVLTREENALYESLMGNNILSFREGGVVGSFSVDPNLTSNKQLNVNVPVSYSGSGTPSQDDEMEMKRLGENIRKAVILEIKNQAKPGTVLDNTFRRK